MIKVRKAYNKFELKTLKIYINYNKEIASKPLLNKIKKNVINIKWSLI